MLVTCSTGRANQSVISYVSSNETTFFQDQVQRRGVTVHVSQVSHRAWATRHFQFPGRICLAIRYKAWNQSGFSVAARLRTGQWYSQGPLRERHPTGNGSWWLREKS